MMAAERSMSRTTVFCPGCGGDWDVDPPAREPGAAAALPDVIECECGTVLEIAADGGAVTAHAARPRAASWPVADDRPPHVRSIRELVAEALGDFGWRR